MHVSASQVSKERRCQRIIAWEYVHGIKPPPSLKQKFGLDVHAQLERWLKSATPPDNTPEGKTAKQGIKTDWLPIPGPSLGVELKFKFPFWADVEALGFVDCCVPGEIPIIIDHKTTTDLRYSKTDETLPTDPQAIIYALWAMIYFKVPQALARWIYYVASAPKNGERKPKGSKKVEHLFDIRDPGFKSEVFKVLNSVARIEWIRKNKMDALSLPPSPRACGDFGGCDHRGRCALTLEQVFEGFYKE